MSELSPFVKHFIEESLKKNSIHEIHDLDFNKACSVIHEKPINIAPRSFLQGNNVFSFYKPTALNVYASKTDFDEDYLLKAEQIIAVIHGIKNHAVFEIRGNNRKIYTSFYANRSDIEVIEAAIKTILPNSVTEIGNSSYLTGNYYPYDFIPSQNSPFYRALTSFQTFKISPLNLIVKILSKIEKGIGVYQVVIKPLPGMVHSIVEESIDSEYIALMGSDTRVKPSLQGTDKDINYKSSQFKNYFSICARLILPTDNLKFKIRAFKSSYVYNSKAFSILDNKHYSKKQILEMVNKRASFHSGFLVNTHELTGLLHIPFQILNEKEFDEIFLRAPVGDKPSKTSKYRDIVIGTYVCGNSEVEVHLPVQIEIPHAHYLGKSRYGKSVSLSHNAINKFLRREAVFVFDPHGDLILNILKMVPRHLLDKVILLDFGLKGIIPQITIKGNVDLTNPSKVSDDLSESMSTVGTNREKFFGPKMAYYFQCLYFIYCVIPELDLTHVRLLISKSKKAKILRAKVKAKINHPIIKDFLDEIEYTQQESVMPVITILSHLLLPEDSLKLFTIKKNKISIQDIMENGNLCLINLSIGIIGKMRSSILSGVFDSLIMNNAIARASIPYELRKPCTVIKDEFYLGTGDLDMQLTGLAKYGVSVMFAHQYLDQVDGNTREVMGTAGTRVIFNVRRKDAEILGKDFGIAPEEFTSLKKFQAIAKIEDEVVKINTPKPVFNKEDYSEEIIKNCIEKYYLKVDKKPVSEKKILTFDTL